MHPSGGDAGRPEQARVGGLDALGLGWLLLVVVWLTLTPFSPRSGEVALRLAPSLALHDVVGNALLFAPAGVVLGARRRGRRLRASLWMLVGASAGIELAQLGVAGRVASPYDVLLNGAGAAAAAGLASRAAAGGRLRPGVMTASVLVLVYVGAAAYVAASASVVRHGLRLHRWAPEFEVLAGDEPDGSRPYAGVVTDARICAPGSVCVRPGAAPTEREALVAAVQQLQRVTLSASVVSGSESQHGPARIVTFSAGADRRNATLAQEGQRLILRVRTAVGGDNGVGLQLALPAGIGAGDSVRVVGSHDRGALSLAVHSARGARSVRYRPTPLDAWFALRRPGVVERRDVLVVRASTALVLLFPLPLVLVAARHRRTSGTGDTGVARALH